MVVTERDFVLQPIDCRCHREDPDESFVFRVFLRSLLPASRNCDFWRALRAFILWLHAPLLAAATTKTPASMGPYKQQLIILRPPVSAGFKRIYDRTRHKSSPINYNFLPCRAVICYIIKSVLHTAKI